MLVIVEKLIKAFLKNFFAVMEKGDRMKITLDIPDNAKWVYLDLGKGKMFGMTVKGNYISNIIEMKEEERK